MSNTIGLTKFQLDALKEINSIGTGNATTALSQFINKTVAMEPPEVVFVAGRGVVPGFIAQERAAMTMVALDVSGQVSGHIFVIFESKDTLPLIDLLLGKSAGSTQEPVSDIDLSAFKEVVSVMSGAYLKVLGEMINITLGMSTPYFETNTSAKVQESVVARAIGEGEATICLKSQVCVMDAKKILGYLLFIPSPSSLGVLLELLGIEKGKASADN